MKQLSTLQSGQRLTSRSSLHRAYVNFLALRLLIALLAVPLTVYTVLVVRTTIVTSLTVLGSAFPLGLIAASALCCWFALRGSGAKSRRLMLYSLIGAGVVGGVGFALGFFGPLIITPRNNLGPLWGFFVTGPLGFATGALVGLIIGFFRVRSPTRGMGS